MIVRGNYSGHSYEGPENRIPLMFKPSEHSKINVRIGWIFVDALGWPRIEAEPWMF